MTRQIDTPQISAVLALRERLLYAQRTMKQADFSHGAYNLGIETPD
jgi:hypothetical protein